MLTHLTVNGEAISREDVEREYRRLLQALSPRLPPEDLARSERGLQRQALEHAIGRRLLLQEARRRDIRVPPEDVESALRELVRDCGGETGLPARLAELKLSLAELRRQVLEALQTERLIADLTAVCPEPTESEIAAYAREHAHELLGGTDAPDSPPSPAAMREQARRRLAAAGKNAALAAFIAGLKRSAAIE